MADYSGYGFDKYESEWWKKYWKKKKKYLIERKRRWGY